GVPRARSRPGAHRRPARRSSGEPERRQHRSVSDRGRGQPLTAYDEDFWRDTAEAAREHGAIETRRRRSDALEMWLATCPPDFAGADWQGVLARRPAHSPDVLVPAEAWCETPVRSLLLMGDVGAGKTYLACAVARRLVVGVGAWATFTTVEG